HEYEGAGCFLFSMSCEPERTQENMIAARRILNEVLRSPITADELEQARNKRSTRGVTAGEIPYNRLYEVGFNWLFRKEYQTVQEDVDRLDAVTLDDLHAVAEAFPLAAANGVALGPLEKLDW
ncbi:MAG: M16 family metallopeptidase, partial [Planctomycetia bacterium]